MNESTTATEPKQYQRPNIGRSNFSIEIQPGTDLYIDGSRLVPNNKAIKAQSIYLVQRLPVVEGSLQYVPKGLMVDYRCEVIPSFEKGISLGRFPKAITQELRDLISQQAFEAAKGFEKVESGPIDVNVTAEFHGCQLQLKYYMWP